MKYSIITINYNHAEGLRRTIESVVNQTCKDYEYIIIDGGSTDGSVDIIKEYSDKIDFWVSEPDKGIYNAMNKGIDHAHGEYLNFMNSGDCFYAPTVLEEVMPLLMADIVSGIDNVESENRQRCPISEEKLSMMTMFYNTVPHQSTFIKREVNEKFRYDESIKISSDWEFFVESIIMHNCSYRDIAVTVCEFEPGGLGSLDDSVEYWEKEHRDVLMKMLPKRIYKDYLYYHDKESPILDLIPKLREHRMWRLHQWIVRFVSIAIKVYDKILKLINK